MDASEVHSAVGTEPEPALRTVQERVAQAIADADAAVRAAVAVTANSHPLDATEKAMELVQQAHAVAAQQLTSTLQAAAAQESAVAAAQEQARQALAAAVASVSAAVHAQASQPAAGQG